MKNAKTKCVDVAKDISKMKANYICEKCGATREVRQIHGAHIMPATYNGTAADPENIITLCSTCHSIGRTSAHQDPIQFGIWFEDRYPGRYEKLNKKAQDYTKNPIKIDWDELRQDLLKIKKSML